MIVDLSTSDYTPTTVPDGAWVPLSQAHLIVAAGKATVYRWYAQDRLTARELAVNARATTLHVNAGDVRELYKRLRSKRHAERRRAGVRT
ncbi:hypothetical protein [Microbacterium sp. UBA3394]|uniref:hypothetical protein n=1 Tax=Microbacterium sp. UBA3394 TaxID=1946945 RepID=UPI000C4FABEE|nr:hypothetical protein [Microbacterium sp. UBA3394]MAB81721.1 hypothetical protein [Planctomycetota bacterium]MAM53553.1 hypothetical protein [Microbacterium sp.]